MKTASTREMDLTAGTHTLRLFHLGLDLLCVPTASGEYCRDKWFERYGETVRRENDIPKYVAWALKEVAKECAS
jgi:hypothetical protein